MGTTSTDAPTRAPEARKRDPERTREDILRVATSEFAERGLAGGRVDEIAAKTATTKRMIYYYFGSKEGLYLAVMEEAYGAIRAAEQDLDVAHLPPVEALRSLAASTYDYATTHPDFIRLVAIENIHRAEHIRKSKTMHDRNSTAVTTLAQVLARGIAQGIFRDDIDAVDVHMMISSYAFFAVANQHTFGLLFDRDLLDPDRHEHYRTLACDMIVSTMTANPGTQHPAPSAIPALGAPEPRLAPS